MNMAKLLNAKIVGRNIRRIRLERGLTQAQTVAKLQLLDIPLSRSIFSLIEMGWGNIFVSDFVALKMVFQVEFEDFFETFLPHGRQDQRNKTREAAAQLTASCAAA